MESRNSSPDWVPAKMPYFFNFEKTAYLRGTRTKDCILCTVLTGAGEEPDLRVHEGALASVSLNLYPYNAGHLIVFPKRHCKDLRELSEEEEREISKLIRLSLDVLEDLYSPCAFNTGCNMGHQAGASIEHLHWHVIPRYPNEIGIAELIAGQRVIVEHPRDTLERVQDAFKFRSGN